MKHYLLMASPDDGYYGDNLATSRLFTETQVKLFERDYGEGPYWWNEDGAYSILSKFADSCRSTEAFYFKEIGDTIDNETFTRTIAGIRSAKKFNKEVEWDDDFRITRFV